MKASDLITFNRNFKNRIINGDFSVWQRGEGITGNSYYVGVDRFLHWSNGKDSSGNLVSPVCDYTDDKVMDGNDFTLKCTVSNVNTSTTDNAFGITQRVEPLMFWDLINKNITVSFWVKTNKDTIHTYIGHVYLDSSSNQVWEPLYSNYVSVTPDEWKRIVYTIKLESAHFTTIGNTIFLEFAVEIDNIQDNDYIQLKQYQVEEGEVATDFEYVPYDIQLQRCMRYFEQLYASFTLYSNGGEIPINCLQYKVIKRVEPSVTKIDGTNILNGGIGIRSFSKTSIAFCPNDSPSSNTVYRETNFIVNVDAEL